MARPWQSRPTAKCDTLTPHLHLHAADAWFAMPHTGQKVLEAGGEGGQRDYAPGTRVRRQGDTDTHTHTHTHETPKGASLPQIERAADSGVVHDGQGGTVQTWHLSHNINAEHYSDHRARVINYVI